MNSVQMATERQEALLGCMVIDPSCIDEIALKLEENMFLTRPLRLLWKHLLRLNDEGIKTIDLLMLRDAMGSDWREMGGAEYFGYISNLEFSSASANKYTLEIIEFYRKTKLSQLATSLDGILNSDKRSDDIIADMEQAISDLDQTRKRDVSHIKQVECSFEPDSEEYLKTQFVELNNIIIGLGKTALIAVIGSTGMGKTSLMIDFLLEFGYYQNLPSAFFSCELSNQENKQRLCCNLAEKSYKAVKLGYTSDIDKQLLYEAARQLGEKPIFLDKTPGLTPSELRRKLASLHRRHDLRVAFVDHLHNMKPGKRSEGRLHDLAYISKELKNIATEFEFPIVMGAQVSRECARDKRRPTEFDIRDCGEVEEACDLILTPYRPSQYGILDEPTTISELKGRNCGKGTIEVQFLENISSFRPI